MPTQRWTKAYCLKCLLPAGRTENNTISHIFAPELLYEPRASLSSPVRESLHLLIRHQDEFEAPRSGKNAEIVAETGS
jgi:hypothetical protein